MKNTTVKYIIVAGTIAMIIILVELVKSRALSSFWKVAGSGV